MRFIEHIIEPTELLLAWQSSSEEDRSRYIVGRLHRTDAEITLQYLVDTPDFRKARDIGFDLYPAFKDEHTTYSNVLDAFMRRLPPRKRGDFPQYLEGLRLKPDVDVSDFALLGYSGAKLLADGFSIIHPFNNVKGPCEILTEVAGFRHIKKNDGIEAKIDTPVSFEIEEFHPVTQQPAIKIITNGTHLGYVNRGLIATFLNWIADNRITNAWVEKANGTPDRPTAYIYVEVASKKT